MTGLKTTLFKIILDTGLVVELNDHLELLVKLFLTILAKDPFQFGVNVTVKYFQ
jgi:hypothetical protein